MKSQYRYTLSRTVNILSNRLLLVCMLNPSTADEQTNDPTISRLCRLTESNGFGNLKVINLLGVRETNPQNIWLHGDPVGEENWKIWNQVIKSLNPNEDMISVAWGRSPKSQKHLTLYRPILKQASFYLDIWKNPLMTWITNVDGSPRHPLYINANEKLKSYNLNSYLEKTRI